MLWLSKLASWATPLKMVSYDEPLARYRIVSCSRRLQVGSGLAVGLRVPGAGFTTVCGRHDESGLKCTGLGIRSGQWSAASRCS